MEEKGREKERRTIIYKPRAIPRGSPKNVLRLRNSTEMMVREELLWLKEWEEGCANLIIPPINLLSSLCRGRSLTRFSPRGKISFSLSRDPSRFSYFSVALTPLHHSIPHSSLCLRREEFSGQKCHEATEIARWEICPAHPSPPFPPLT